MDRGVAVMVMAVVGGLIALQPAINAGLGRATGNIAAAFVSFAIGTPGSPSDPDDGRHQFISRRRLRSPG